MMLKLLASILTLGFLIAAVRSTQPTMQIRQGVLKGVYMRTVNNRLFAAYLGIPYAKPPIGKYRFKESVSASPWIGVYNATSYSDDCLQYSHERNYNVYGSEDCLYLNVYTPKLSSGSDITEPLDVVVYIHGGAFMFLSGSYNRAEFLLEKDVILVTMNYRLGPLGFLSTEDDVLPGNNGLKDQNLALKWIKNNIAAFGGNPNSITLTGMSAGGASVHYHVLSPLSQGLFNKAISFGGSALCPWTQMENARQKTMKLADYLGCPTNESLLALKCLRDRPASHIVAGSKMFQPWLYTPFSPFGVVIEPPTPSAFITKRPIDIILQKKSKDLPILFTMNSNEGLYPGAEILAEPKNMEAIENNWNEYLPHLLDYNYTAPVGQLDIISKKIRDFYLGMSSVKDSQHEFIKMIGDRLFYADIINAAKLQAEHYQSPIYAYLFSYRGSKSLADFFHLSVEAYNGAAHGDDLGYIIRDISQPIEKYENDMIISKRLIDYILTFIKGAPMPKRWPTIQENLPNFGFLEIQNVEDINDIVRIEADYGNEIFWNSLGLNENQINARLKTEL